MASPVQGSRFKNFCYKLFMLFDFFKSKPKEFFVETRQMPDFSFNSQYFQPMSGDYFRNMTVPTFA